MRTGRTLLACLLLAFPAHRLNAASPIELVDHIVHQLSRLMPDGANPRVQQARAEGPSIDVSKLDSPALLELELRGMIKEPIADTRMSVNDGLARIGDFGLSSSETHRGHLVVLRGNADIYGRLEGNLVTLDGDIILRSGATVNGDILAIGGTIRDHGGTVSGSSAMLTSAGRTRTGGLSSGLTLFDRVSGVAALLATVVVLGFMLVTFGRPNLEIVSDTVSHSFGRSLLAGMLGQVLLVPTAGIITIGLVLTLAGSVLIPFAVAVYLMLAIVAVLGGLLAVAHAMGEVMTRRRLARGVVVSPNSYRYLITGLGVLASLWFVWAIFGAVPVAGGLTLFAAGLVTWLAGTAGFGAALLSRGGMREEFTGRTLSSGMMTDEYLWATPMGVPAVKRPASDQ
jgi:hypothetical protein